MGEYPPFETNPGQRPESTVSEHFQNCVNGPGVTVIRMINELQPSLPACSLFGITSNERDKLTRIIFLLALIAGFAPSFAQEFDRTLNHVTLVVSNFEESKTFYTELLGLEQIDAPWLPDNQMFLELGENLELHVGEVDGVEIMPNGFNHFAIAVDDFDAFLNYLKSEGVIYTSLGGGEDYFISTRPDNVRQTWISDPDGYWIEINDAN